MTSKLNVFYRISGKFVRIVASCFVFAKVRIFLRIVTFLFSEKFGNFCGLLLFVLFSEKFGNFCPYRDFLFYSRESSEKFQESSSGS